MSGFVIDFNGIKHIDFHQASIYTDACFLLSYLDLSDNRGDKVSAVIDKWSKDEIKEIAISNHVMGEVVHTLFKNHIRDVLTIVHKSRINNEKICNDDLSLIGDLWISNKITDLVPRKKLDTLLVEGELFYNIDTLIKDFKNTYDKKRQGLDFYYNEAVNKYNGMLHDLSELGLKIVISNSTEDVHHLALSIMRTSQIDSHDAIHLAIARLQQYEYFATLDSDFVHNYYSKELIGKLRILKVS